MPGSTLAERIFAIFITIFAIIILAGVISNVTNVVLQWQTAWEKQQGHMVTVLAYFEKHEISRDLKDRVRINIGLLQREMILQQQVQEEETFMKLLPTALRRSVLEEVRASHVERNPCFLAIKNIVRRCFERLCCDAFRAHHEQPNKLVFRYGACCRHMFFVVGGKMTYLEYKGFLPSFCQVTMTDSMRANRASDCAAVDSSATALLKEKLGENSIGHFVAVSEPALWMSWEHAGDCYSHSHNASMLLLRVDDFLTLCSSYSDVQDALRKHAARFVNMLSSEERNQSDLFDSLRMMKEWSRGRLSDYGDLASANSDDYGSYSC